MMKAIVAQVSPWDTDVEGGKELLVAVSQYLVRTFTNLK
jgi:hypothetical protein